MENILINPEVKKKLKKHAESLGVSVTSLDIQDAVKKGDNYLGVITKATVEGKRDNKDVKLSWIVKSSPQTKSHRDMANVDVVYTREIYVYKELFPIFDRFQRERSVAAPFSSHAPYVTSYYEPYQECIIMEDMGPLGFVMKDKKEPMSLDFVKLVMKTYGKLHAISFAIKDQDSKLFQEIRDKTRENYFTPKAEEMWTGAIGQFCEKALNVLDPKINAKEIKVYGKFIGSFLDIMSEIFTKANDDPYAVVGHGDSWSNNMLFKYGDEKDPSRPTEVCLLDFQLLRFGSPAFDLSYFLFTCTDKSFRDQYYDQMILIYYYSLCAHVADLGSDPEKLFPFKALQAHLKRYSAVGYTLSVMVLHLMLSEFEELPDLREDNDPNDMFTYTTKNQSSYNDRVRGIIEDFVAKGYFDFIDVEYKN